MNQNFIYIVFQLISNMFLSNELVILQQPHFHQKSENKFTKTNIHRYVITYTQVS